MKKDKNMIILFIKRRIALLIIPLIFCPILRSQNKGTVEMVKMSTENINPVEKAGYQLLNSKGSQVGNYAPDFTDPKKPKYTVSLKNGAQCKIEALTHIVASEKADRVITYGDDINYSIPHKVDINIYTLAGESVKKIQTGIQYPFKANTAPDGSFYILGYKPVQTGKNGCFLIKYSNSGKLEWEKPIDFGMPNDVVISDNSQYVAIANYSQSTYKITVFSSSGQIIGTVGYSSKTYIEFVNNTFVTAYNGILYAYNLKTFTLLSSGKYEGRLIEPYPITYSPTNKLVMVLSTSGNNIILHAYNIGNCQLKYKKTLSGASITNKYYRTLESDNQEVRLATDNEEFKVTFSGN